MTRGHDAASTFWGTLSLAPGGGRAIADETASAEGLTAAVRTGVDEVRWRNGLSIGWLRIGLRVATLVIWIATASSGGTLQLGSREFWLASAVNAAHLAVGVSAIILLQRRWQVPRVLLGAALVDLLVVAVAGWRTGAGDGESIAYLMGVLELMLLFAALVLPRRQSTWLAASATLYLAFLGLRVGMEGWFVLTMVITLGAFSVAVTWAGTRMVSLAARTALDDYTGRLVRRHRDELAAAHAEVSAQRDRVVAAHAEAEALSRLVVHDLKNPLAALLQFVSLAESRLAPRNGSQAEPPLAEVREDLRLASEEGQRLASMVGDLVLVSRLERGSQRLKLQRTPVAAVLEELARAAAPRAQDREVSLTVAADPDLMAAIDLDLVRRLLDNLLGNALRFVERSGRVELAARLAGPALELAVRTSGPPVPAAVRPLLFEKAAPDALRQVHSTGLGLYLCRLVAEAHGGRMAFVETPEWPVTFEARLTLPEARPPIP